MSYDAYDCDEPWNFWVERAHAAKRPVLCSACGRTIPVGADYVKVTAGIADPDWRDLHDLTRIRRCAPCDAVFRHLQEIGSPHDRYPDAQLGCGRSYEEEWGEPPPHIAAMATADPREVRVDADECGCHVWDVARFFRREADEEEGGE